MPAPSLFSVAVIGLLAGLAARWIVGRRQSPFASLTVGVLGAVLGTAVGEMLGLPVTTLPALALASVAGAAAVLSLTVLIRRR